MVTVSKQAKLALTAIVLIFIIAVIFLAFNFKQASAVGGCGGTLVDCSLYGFDAMECDIHGCEIAGDPPEFECIGPYIDADLIESCSELTIESDCISVGCTWEEGPIDSDDDGYASDVDCIDSIQDCADKYSGTIEEDICSQEMANINPGAEEVCDDNLDNNCDGLTDEADPSCVFSINCIGTPVDCSLYGFDAMECDIHGCEVAGDPPEFECTGPYVGINLIESCNELTESNCDSIEGCGWDSDEDGYASDVDCNDNDANINPGATELCNQIDDDCDELIDEDFDTDGDGYFDEIACAGIYEPLDCDDTDTEVSPGIAEICDDDAGKDNNCDGLANCLDQNCDGTFSCEFGIELTCNDGLDNNGDGLIDCEDSDCSDVAECIPCTDNDGDGYGAEGTEIQNCIQKNNYDCADSDADIHPFALEVCDDGLDNDCDSKIDYDDEDCEEIETECAVGIDERVCGIGLCTGNQPCIEPGTWGECDGAEPKAELCNQEDDDCDSLIDEDFDVDEDGYFDSPACEGVYEDFDCDDTASTGLTVYPGATELCIGDADEDCDGDPNNGCETPPSANPVSSGGGNKKRNIADETLLTAPICGDNTCDISESAVTCCKDCGCRRNYVCVANQCVPPTDANIAKAKQEACGNGICESDYGETKETCPSDCETKVYIYGGALAAILAMFGIIGWYYYIKTQGELSESDIGELHKMAGEEYPVQ